MAIVRAFIAAKTDLPAQALLRDALAKFSATGADVKWIHDFNLHITIKFLGNVEEECLEDIEDGLKEAVKGFGSIALAIDWIEAIPNINYPRIICASIGGELKKLADLEERVEANLFKLGFPKKKRKFFPHITLGRVKSFKGKSKLIAELHQFHKKGLVGMEIEKIHLIKSELKPSGAIYEDLATIPLPQGR